MYQINLYSVGKNKEQWLTDALEIYRKRLNFQIKLNFMWAKDINQLLKWLEKEKNILTFDPKGQALDSVQFSNLIFSELDKKTHTLALVIGDYAGLPKELKDHKSISLSKLIFTHQMSRVIVAEQIYRAVEIKKGSPYHSS